MSNKLLIILIAIFMGICCLTNFVSIAQDKTEEGIESIVKTIVVRTYEGIRPPILDAKQGTTVVWVNRSRTPQEILFLDKKVVQACGSPINFFIGENGAYESGKMPFGGTASLCFTEKGKYDYIVKASITFDPGMEKEHKGTIVIK